MANCTYSLLGRVFNSELELDPIRTDYTDSVFENESEEAIVKNVTLNNNTNSNSNSQE